MVDAKAINEALNYYIRPATFPLAFHLFQKETELPPKAKQPRRDLGYPIPICQAVGMARRYGWSIAMGMEDISCPIALLALGFLEAKDSFLDGRFAEGPFMGPQEARARAAAELKRFDYGKYQGLLISCLHNTTVEPDFITIYGNSAQVMRLVQGCLYGRGGALHSMATGGADCADIIVQTFDSDECQYILPCNGDRVFGMTADDEMIFTMPKSQIDITLKGLEETHKIGQRYPIPAFMRFQPEMPSRYGKFMDFLKSD